MKEDFLALQNQMLERFPDLEKRREESVKNIEAAKLIMFLGFFIFVPLATVNVYGIVALIFYFIIILVYSSKRWAKITAFKKHFDLFKYEYIKALLKKVDNSFIYNGGIIPFSDIKKANLFKPKLVSVYGLKGEDYFSGQYNGVKIQVSEVAFGIHGEVRSTLMIANFNKTLKAETYLIERSFFRQSKKTNNKNLSTFLRPRGDEVILENPSF